MLKKDQEGAALRETLDRLVTRQSSGKGCWVQSFRKSATREAQVLFQEKPQTRKRRKHAAASLAVAPQPPGRQALPVPLPYPWQAHFSLAASCFGKTNRKLKLGCNDGNKSSRRLMPEMKQAPS